MTHRNTLVERAGGLAVITLNRADQMNPLDWGTVRALRDQATPPPSGECKMPRI